MSGVVVGCGLFFVLLGFTGAPQSGDGMAQLKELARGCSLYAEDWEGTYPLAMGHANGVWLHPQRIEAPAGLSRDSSGERKRGDASAWVNSLAPYWKSNSLLTLPGAPVKKLGLKLEDTLKDPWLVGVTYNGLLHRWPKGAVPHPELVPVIWTGLGRVNREGVATASPLLLQCGFVSDPCGFEPSATAWAMRASLIRMEGPVATFDGAIVLGMLDGSARRILPVKKGPSADSDDPFVGYGVAGEPSLGKTDRSGYPALFRPDRQPKK